MIKIRRNVFETNSSSTHSICITKNSVELSFPEKIILKLGYFGWEHAIYNDAESKASYLYTAIKSFEVYDKKLSNEWLNFLCETLLKNNVKYDFDNDEKYYGIDHCGELKDFVTSVCHSEKRLLRFLFSSESFVLTENDNEDCTIHVNWPSNCEEYFKGN